MNVLVNVRIERYVGGILEWDKLSNRYQLSNFIRNHAQ